MGNLGSSLALGPGAGERAPGEALPNPENFRPLARSMNFVEPELYEDLACAAPSARIEIAAARAEAHDHPRVPWPVADPRPGEGRLHLLSPADELELRQRPGYPRQARPAAGDPAPGRRPHPRSRGGRHHASAQRHRRARLPRRHRRAGPARGGVDHKSRRSKFESDGRNVNALNPNAKADMGESTTVHAVEVEVARVGRGR